MIVSTMQGGDWLKQDDVWFSWSSKVVAVTQKAWWGQGGRGGGLTSPGQTASSQHDPGVCERHSQGRAGAGWTRQDWGGRVCVTVCVRVFMFRIDFMRSKVRCEVE